MAVHKDVSGNAHDLHALLRAAIARAGRLIETTFARSETDLFGEQIGALRRAGWNLMKAGLRDPWSRWYAPEMAYSSCVPRGEC